MPVIFAGVILGFIVMFFVLAWAVGAIFFIVPVVVLVVLGIQVFLRIRDQVLDKRDPNR